MNRNSALVYRKTYFNLAKNYLFEGKSNKVKKRYVINFLVPEKKFILSNFFRTMYDVYGVACFDQKMFKNELNMSLLQQT